MWSNEHRENYMIFTEPLEFRINPEYAHEDELVEGADIGLWFDGKSLEDYDGVFELPKEAIKLIDKLIINNPK